MNSTKFGQDFKKSAYLSILQWHDAGVLVRAHDVIVPGYLLDRLHAKQLVALPFGLGKVLPGLEGLPVVLGPLQDPYPRPWGVGKLDDQVSHVVELGLSNWNKTLCEG